ncbi:hypothetical protein BDQ94DRAFT_163642 [Aspergillus welwitschiae]|uniref:Uncharacterized protein n=1 Tax=Aspergillus welwitschiae TaxID=1341132 RepID=A0A3F3PKC3_9EURO|nr:hypothetical protein BDQ94DRAFT_163642 [Aspergillus welwitschiae]RDH27404.1 hypothetical protein BDQ94DRAFT_163642 [Aspergillus welwitschiae]
MTHGYKGVRLTPLMVPDFHDCDERLIHQPILQAATCPGLLKDELYACVVDTIAMGYVHLQDRQARSKGYYMVVKKRTSA